MSAGRADSHAACTLEDSKSRQKLREQRINVPCLATFSVSLDEMPDWAAWVRLAAFDPPRHRQYTWNAGWSSPVARWAHNPKVVGSNPTPATNQINGLERIRKADSLPFTPNKKIAVQALAFIGEHHLHNPPIASRFDGRRCLSIDVHCHLGRSVPHQFLLHLHRSSGLVQPRTVRVAGRVPADDPVLPSSLHARCSA